MIQPTATRRPRYQARVAVHPRVTTHPGSAAYPFAFLALAFGVIAGVGVAGVVIPAVVQVVVPAVMRIVHGI